MTLTRREALLLWMGRGEQVRLERDQQSAIEGARGYKEGEAPAEPTKAEEEELAPNLQIALNRLLGRG